LPQAAVPAGLVPGWGKILNYAQRMTATTEQAWIAYRTPQGRHKILVLTVPNSPEGQGLIEEVRRRSGERWREQRQSLLALRREFGISNRWMWLGVLVAFLVVGPTLLLLIFAQALFWSVVWNWWYVSLFMLAAWWVYKRFRQGQG
jgi:hypothetical protein